MAKEDMTMDQVYNCDETALCYEMMPAKTLARKQMLTEQLTTRNPKRDSQPCCAVRKLANTRVIPL